MRKANASSGATFVWAAVGGRNALDVSGGGNHRADFFLALSSLTCVTHALATALRLFFSLFLSNACWGATGGRRPCLYTFAHLVTSWAARCAQQHALGVQRKQIPQPSQCVELQKRKLEYWEEIEKEKKSDGPLNFNVESWMAPRQWTFLLSRGMSLLQSAVYLFIQLQQRLGTLLVKLPL